MSEDTLPRLVNRYSKLKLVWHPGKLQSFLDEKVTAPVYVRVKPTNHCNHRCFYCVYEEDFSGIHPEMKRRDQIPRNKMQEILRDFQDMGVKAITYSGGGEPLLYPWIEETLRDTLEKKIDLSMITNGQCLKGEAAELLGQGRWVRVSADYCDEDTFVASRRIIPTKFQEVAENINRFAQSKKPECSLGVNFVVHEHNYDHIYEGAKFFRDLGVENVRFAPLWSPQFETYHVPIKNKVIEEIERAKVDFNTDTFTVGDSYRGYFELTGLCHRGYTHCYFMQVVPAIGADCGVYFCHNKAYDPTGCFGSIKERSFRDLWFSEETARIMKEFNPQEGCRHECANDQKNVLIHEMVACSDPSTRNFP